MSPAEAFDIRKTILAFSLIKPRWNNEVILRNFELFIYGDIQYTCNLFLKRSAQVAIKCVMNLWARLQNYVKRILASTRLSVSVRPHGTPRLKMAGFSRNVILEFFREICLEN